MATPPTTITSIAMNALLDHLGPAPKFDIPLVLQHEDAWCYAACTEMIVNFVRQQQANAQFIGQCDVASYAKSAVCCVDVGVMDIECTDSGCQKNQIPDILAHFGTRAEQTGPLSIAEVDRQINTGDPANGRPPSPLLAIVDWGGDPGSHAIIVAGVLGEMVYILDPLEDDLHGGWRDLDDLNRAFGHGDWVETWLGFRGEGS